MYRLINENSENLVKSFNKKSVSRYLATLDENRKQDDFKSFYGLNAAHLCDNFLAEYFNILNSKTVNGVEIGKDAENAAKDALLIVAYLETIPSNSKGQHKVQFSFATKLLHTINQNCPIYDNRLADLFFFPYIGNCTKVKKLSAYEKIYNFLINEFKRIQNEKLLEKTVQVFCKEVADFSKITSVKQFDFILWHFSLELRKGLIIENFDFKYK